MNKTPLKIVFLMLSVFMLNCNNAPKKDAVSKTETPNLSEERKVWSVERANDWYDNQPWLIGANFNPSTSINQLEMWQATTFDVETIDKELGWAEAIGMNSMRVYLHDLLFMQDAEGFFKRMDTFLGIAEKHRMKILFVLFDSCWDPFPELGKQRAPKPHVHNSGWVQSPGQKVLQDTTQYNRLEDYTKETVKRFANDSRVLGWDVWNEPDNMTGPSYEKIEISNKVELVEKLLASVFEWARSSNPSQPLTSGIWLGDWSTHEKLATIQQLQIEQSDVISFHNYDDRNSFEERINWLLRYNKPLLCTEYMARPNGSTFQDFLPIAKKHKVAMYNWGLVDGKTQTKYPWDSWTKTYTAEPEVWFHEVFQNDGTPYRNEETAFIKQISSIEKSI
ncbi:cellulase family glycosylhydrolase [Flavivirga sp. 57AJ16]|uniref:cellulase family glycosylhydrolase n=1 Tax=Flavivirga sp. 57AJ16 TaxID=3025307 RepID=UPI00236614BB|nr:cellulase family glycosylhydrolase [Flavivirga sp. 57AJ16]MDD7886280.1 cellulase family glycosylhydrolase [Flavivirga sp. 57AJ16]